MSKMKIAALVAGALVLSGAVILARRWYNAADDY